MSRLILASFLLLTLVSLGSPNPTAIASTQKMDIQPQAADSRTADLELALRYVPVFYFHPDEIYVPQPVEVLDGITRVRQSVRLWFDTTIWNKLLVEDLSSLSSDENSFLDQWFGDTGSSEYANYTSHQAIYEATLSPAAGGPAPLAYAHVVRNEDPGYITIQYWLFYFYNDWFNKHEGDWEMVEVILSADEQPEWLVYSQHKGGARRSWTSAPIEAGTHPVVYVARGSHANYFAGDEVYPNKTDIGNRKLVLVDRTGKAGRLVPGVSLIPTRAEFVADPASWPGAGWLMFRGRWGETAVYGDFNGPTGPADKGAQWDTPYAWGMSQTLDVESWYLNRLQVEITGTAQVKAGISLVDKIGQMLPASESIGNLAILHVDPPSKILALVKGTPGVPLDVTVNWPEHSQELVTRTSFSGLVLDDTGQAYLELSSGNVVYQPTTDHLLLSSHLLDSYTAIWDARDIVLASYYLSLSDVLVGLLICFLVSVLPVLLLIAILYWIDRYHRGPIRLLAVAFAWGAIPALLITFLIQLFFKLPANLAGPNALEVVRLGFLAPVLEEIFKAGGVIFIFWRFRREITDVLDGMIYGAIVGFGFAFISNLFRYAGDFLLSGYPALNLGFVIVRTVHVLDHGLYTAIFGAGLGFAILYRRKLRFWIPVVSGLLMAIAVHALQNLLSNSLVGMNVFTVIVTGAGTLLLAVVAGWSLVQQRRLLRLELLGVVPGALYSSMQDPLVRHKAQWSALRRDGLYTWIRLRRLQGLCIKFAHLRLQARLHPEKYQASEKADALAAEIARIFETLSPPAD